MRLLLLSLSCFGFLGCDPIDRCWYQVDPEVTSAVLLDQPTLSLKLPVEPSGCDRRLTVEVSDERAELVPLELQGADAVWVSFPSRGPGTYHLTIRVDGIDDHQMDVLVLKPDLDEPQARLPKACRRLQPYRQGWLCDSTWFDAQLNATEIPLLDGHPYAVGGDYLWAVHEATGTVYRIDPLTVQPESLVDSTSGSRMPIRSLHATEEELILLRSGFQSDNSGRLEIQRVRAAGGKLTLHGLLVEDSRYVPFDLAGIRVGGAFWVAYQQGGGHRVCEVQFTDESIQLVRCAEEQAGVVRGTGGGLWLQEGTRLSLSEPADDGTWRPRLSLMAPGLVPVKSEDSLLWPDFDASRWPRLVVDEPLDPSTSSLWISPQLRDGKPRLSAVERPPGENIDCIQGWRWHSTGNETRIYAH